MTNETIMNAIYEEANKYGFGMSVMEIDNSLESMQKIVGGYIGVLRSMMKYVSSATRKGN